MAIKSHLSKAEVSVRVLAILFLVSAACIVRSNKQTKKFLSTFEKKASYNDIKVFVVMTIVDLVAAGYNVTHLIRYFGGSKRNGIEFDKKSAWLFLLLDQVVAYVIFSTNSAAAAVSVLAITGADELQWLKMCNTYTRFCIQIGGGLFFGYLASVTMAVVSYLSAYNLFRFYSSTNFLVLKPCVINEDEGMHLAC